MNSPLDPAWWEAIDVRLDDVPVDLGRLVDHEPLLSGILLRTIRKIISECLEQKRMEIRVETDLLDVRSGTRVDDVDFNVGRSI